MAKRPFSVGDKVIAVSRCPLRSVGAKGVVEELTGYGYLVRWGNGQLSPEYKREIRKREE